VNRRGRAARGTQIEIAVDFKWRQLGRLRWPRCCVTAACASLR
jgi:hypothetical protein